MHDIKTFTATPGLARRLLMFSQMNHMLFNEELVDLAMQDLVSPKDLEGFHYPVDHSQLSSLQFVRDWDGRGMILCSTPDRGRIVALANAWLNGGKTLLLVQPKFYSLWAAMVREVFPDAKISVFGNPRYHERGQTFPTDVEFEEKPDLDADIFVSSYGGVIWHNLLNQVTIDQTIVEELDHQGSVNYKWEGAVKGIFHEVPAPLFIQDISSLPSDHGRDNIASLQASGSKALNFIGDAVTNLLWAGITHMGALTNGTRLNETENYLVSRGYTGVDNLKMLSLFGVSSHLLDDAQGHKKPITFFDSTIKDLLAMSNPRSRADSGLHRLVTRERAVEEETGTKIAATVQDALAGHRPAMTLIGGLQTPQWANLKAQHLQTIHGNLANRMSRCLFLTTHHDLKRSLLLNFGLQMEDMSKTDDVSFTMARYLHPMVTTEYLRLPHSKQYMMRPLANLIVTIDDLITEPRLLEASNFLFMAEQPMNQDYFDGIKAAAAASGTRIVNSVIRGTFEEHISKQLR